MEENIYGLYVVNSKEGLVVASGRDAIYGRYRGYRHLAVIGGGQNGISSQEDLRNALLKAIESVLILGKENSLRKLKVRLLRQGFSVSSGDIDAFHG